MGFEVNDLKDVLQPMLDVDKYRSKLGRDDKNCVISFYVDDPVAAADLVSFMERGYDFVLDADVSNSEVSIGRWMVFLEIRRLTSLYKNLEKILKDLEAASGIKAEKWRFRYHKKKKYQEPLDQMKTIAGLPVETPPVEDEDLKNLQNLAGI